MVKEIDLTEKTLDVHARLSKLLDTGYYAQTKVSVEIGISPYTLNRFYHHPTNMRGTTLLKIMKWCDKEEIKIREYQAFLENIKKEVVNKIYFEMIDSDEKLLKKVLKKE